MSKGSNEYAIQMISLGQSEEYGDNLGNQLFIL